MCETQCEWPRTYIESPTKSQCWGFRNERPPSRTDGQIPAIAHRSDLSSAISAINLPCFLRPLICNDGETKLLASKLLTIVFVMHWLLFKLNYQQHFTCLPNWMCLQKYTKWANETRPVRGGMYKLTSDLCSSFYCQKALDKTVEISKDNVIFHTVGAKNDGL